MFWLIQVYGVLIVLCSLLSARDTQGSSKEDGSRTINPVSALIAYSYGGFITASDKQVSIWNTEKSTKKPQKTLLLEYPISGLLELQKNKLIVSFKQDLKKNKQAPCAEIINLNDTTTKREYLLGDDSIDRMVLLSDTHLVTSSNSGIVQRDLISGKSTTLFESKTPINIANVQALSEDTIAYVVDQNINVMFCSKNKTVTLPTKSGYCSGMTVTGDGELLSTSDSWIFALPKSLVTFHKYNFKKNAHTALTVADVTSEWPKGPGADCVVSLSNDYLLATRNCQLKIWDLKKPENKPTVFTHPMTSETDRIAHVAVLNDGGIVTIGDDGSIVVCKSCYKKAQPLQKTSVSKNSDCSIQ